MPTSEVVLGQKVSTGKLGAVSSGHDREAVIRAVAQAITSTIKNLILDGRSYHVVSMKISERQDEPLLSDGSDRDGWKYKGTLLVCLYHLDDAQIGEHVRSEVIREALEHAHGRIESRDDIDPETEEIYKWDYFVHEDGREFKNNWTMWQRVK